MGGCAESPGDVALGVLRRWQHTGLGAQGQWLPAVQDVVVHIQQRAACRVGGGLVRDLDREQVAGLLDAGRGVEAWDEGFVAATVQAYVGGQEGGGGVGEQG